MRDIASRENIKDLILDATDRLLSKHGYQKTTMAQLAHEVGIAKGTLYLHFPSKEELVLSHIDRIIFRLLVKLQTIAHRDRPAAEKLMAMLEMRVLYRYDAVSHYKESLFLLLADIRSGLTARQQRHFEQECRHFAEVLEAGRESGELKIADPRESARAMLIATNSLLPHSIALGPIPDRKTMQRRTSLIAGMLVNGIRER
jgi:AcrR family transcriptional regulator